MNAEGADFFGKGTVRAEPSKVFDLGNVCDGIVFFGLAGVMKDV